MGLIAAQRSLLGSFPPPWVFHGAALDLDFVNDRGWSKGKKKSTSAFLNVTRSSVGYVENSAGVWTQVPANTFRRSDKGMLAEEARTNGIRNNSMQGAVAGTPGTAPTNWTMSTSASGLTREIVGTGVENGVDYLDVKYSGTVSGGTVNLTVRCDTLSGGPAAASGQTWTSSCFLKLVSGSLTGATAKVLYLYGSTGAGQSEVFSTNINPDGTLTRSSVTATLASGTTTNVLNQIIIQFPISTVVDFTLRIGWPQVEQGAFVTSPIRTTSAAATRNADAIVLAVPSIIQMAQGTLYAEWTELGPVSVARTLFRPRVSANDSLTFQIGSGNKIQGIVTAGGVTTANMLTTASIVAGTNYKAAMGYATNDFVLASSLEANVTDVSGAVPTGVPVVGVGENAVGGAQGDCYIKRIAYFPTRLSNAALAALVA